MDYHYDLDLVKDTALEISTLANTRAELWTKDNQLRGQDLKSIIKSKYKGVDEYQILDLALLSDVYLCLSIEFGPNARFEEDRNSKIDIDKIMQAFIKKAEKQIFNKTGTNEWMLTMRDWSREFGCLLSTGNDHDLGLWFWDSLFAFVEEVTGLDLNK